MKYFFKFSIIIVIFLVLKYEDLQSKITFFPIKKYNSFFLKALTNENYETIPEMFDENDMLSDVDDFINIPKGGISWFTFSETEMIEYYFEDEEGMEWIGVKPGFKNKIKQLEGKQILIQGYMFPLEQSEKQSMFLLGPFPITCPYHPHTSSNLIIEVHAEFPILYTYDAINIKGELELVENDEKYNIFYRLKDSVLIK